MVIEQQIDMMRERITDEIFLALGLSKTGSLRRLFGRLFYLPTQRFVQIFSRADEAVGEGGMSNGCRSLVHDFSIQLQIRGAEQIPSEGPLLVVSNHPGAYDSICLASSVQRQDLKIMVWEIPFFRVLPNASHWLLYATEDTTGRMLALKNAIRHLRNGGAVLQFGSGLIEPDPGIFPHTEGSLKAWSPSIEIMLRRALDTCLVLAVASGVLLRKFANHPFARLRREPIDRRRLAEFMQVIQRLLIPSSVQIKACLSFAPPVLAGELAAESKDGSLMPVILGHARELLAEHLKAYQIISV